MFKILLASLLALSSSYALANSKCESKVERDFATYLRSETNLESDGVNQIDKVDARYAIETSEELAFNNKEKARLVKLISKQGIITYDAVGSDGPGSAFYLVIADSKSCKTIRTVHLSDE